MFEEYTKGFCFLGNDCDCVTDEGGPRTETIVFGHNGYGIRVTQDPETACCDPFTVEIRAVVPSRTGCLDVSDSAGKELFGTHTGVISCATKSEMQMVMTNLACMPKHPHWSPDLLERGVNKPLQVVMPVYERAKHRAQGPANN